MKVLPARPFALSLAPGLALLSALTAGCADEIESREDDSRLGWLSNVEAPLPMWLSETGVYVDLAAREPGPGAIAYEPEHALYSNGADKERLLFLPPGGRIDPNPGGPDWRFPVGTVLLKSFSFEDAVGAGGTEAAGAPEGHNGGVTLETRVIARRASGWIYAQYHWDAAGTEALLVGSGGEGAGEDVDWQAQRLSLVDLSGATFDYTMPGKLDCRGCHETAGETPVLGIARWQQPGALAALGDAVYATAPPDPALDALARTPAELEAMSYVIANCAFCHNGRDTGENSAFSLQPPDLVKNTVHRDTESSASGIGVRIVPGDVVGSALYEAVALARKPGYGGDFKPMPPAGIDRVDPLGAQILRRWILSLDASTGGE